MVPGVSIPHPTGRPDLPKEEEKAYRTKIIKKALEALSTEVTEQTVFNYDK